MTHDTESAEKDSFDSEFDDVAATVDGDGRYSDAGTCPYTF